jgi:hypothetical protein
MSESRRESRTPTLCVDRRGYTYAKFNGRQIRFGPEADPNTRKAFDNFLVAWLANGRRLKVAEGEPAPEPFTVRMLAEGYKCASSASRRSSEAPHAEGCFDEHILEEVEGARRAPSNQTPSA